MFCHLKRGVLCRSSNVPVAVGCTRIAAGEESSHVLIGGPASFPTWLQFNPQWLIMWVTLLLLCLSFTCFQCDLTHTDFQLGHVLDLGFRWTFQAPNKLFYRSFPVRMFCSCVVEAPQKWLPRRSLKKEERIAKGREFKSMFEAEGGREGRREQGRAQVETFLVNSSTDLGVLLLQGPIFPLFPADCYHVSLTLSFTYVPR